MPGRPLAARWRGRWEAAGHGGDFSVGHDAMRKGRRRLHPGAPALTQTATDYLAHPDEPRYLSSAEAARIQTFPDDYDFGRECATYVCGMSVPPRMMQRVAGVVAGLLDAAAAPPSTGPWSLTDLARVPRSGLPCFSCFHCGGGSSMGWRLAGFDVLGGVEIDPRMMALYRANLRPRHSYLMGVREFAALDDASLPPALFDLDVLDGSPPCSSFSMAGAREKGWGERKVFREGQARQVLDDLFFDFIAVARKLRPRVVVAENVKGMLHGNARGYVKEIFRAFREAGYACQLFLLNASRMGVPQRRERVFFVANRIGARVRMDFSEPVITVRQAFAGIDAGPVGRALPPSLASGWRSVGIGSQYACHGRRDVAAMTHRVDPGAPAFTVRSSGVCLTHWDAPVEFSGPQHARVQTFPDDYDFGRAQVRYVCGMSVPPRMMQRVGGRVAAMLEQAGGP